MGFEYKEKLKELLLDYMELLEEQGKTENRGDDYWICLVYQLKKGVHRMDSLKGYHQCR